MNSRTNGEFVDDYQKKAGPHTDPLCKNAENDLLRQRQRDVATLDRQNDVLLA